MTTYSELEIGLYRLHSSLYQIELRFSNPESSAEITPQRGECKFEFGTLLQLQDDSTEYGETLTAQLFADERVREMYQRVKAVIEASGQFLRVRLLIGPGAVELHCLRWELLRDPATNAPLSTSEKIVFSRFMTSQDWRAVRLRRKASLTGLIAISAPQDSEEWGLSRIDCDSEVERIRNIMRGIQVEVIGQKQSLTLESLVSFLRSGVDILYLVCHGTLNASLTASLYLQSNDGNAAVVNGAELAERVGELSHPPRMIVLASCESAGTGHAPTGHNGASFQASLAARFAEVGVLAVIAMQGRIQVRTVEKAMPLFFDELLKDGQIDRAMAVARSAVRQEPDYWMPALFLRLRGGRMWYQPGFAHGEEDFEKWKSIVYQVNRGRAVAILGSGLAESLCGDSHELAEKLALSHGFPLAPYQRNDLPHVTQYLSVIQSPTYAVDAAIQQTQRCILQRNPALPDVLQDAALSRLLDEIVARTPPDGTQNPYQVLANLPISIYVCATPDTLLLKALKQAGKSPTLLYTNWRPTRDNQPVRPSYAGVPSPQAPIVYHLLGVYSKYQSLVLTEDDYFDFMISTCAYQLIPDVVKSALSSSSLLFMGFRLMDWSFRILFRLVQSLEGAERRSEMSHVGVQVDPSEATLTDVGRARRYLEKYFDKEANLGVFWGGVDDFLRELAAKLQSIDVPPPLVVAEDEDEWY